MILNMNAKTLIGKIELPTKKKALMRYFNAQNFARQSGDKLSLAVKFDPGKSSLFDEEEIIILTSEKDARDERDIEKWSNVISFSLSIDSTASKYYYKLLSSIFIESVWPSNIVDHADIKKNLFDYLSYTFTACVLNKFFYNLLDLESPVLLKKIPFIQYGVTSKYCLLLTNEYKIRKDEIILETKTIFEEVVDTVKDLEYLPDSLVERFVDETDQKFIIDLRLDL